MQKCLLHVFLCTLALIKKQRLWVTQTPSFYLKSCSVRHGESSCPLKLFGQIGVTTDPLLAGLGVSHPVAIGLVMNDPVAFYTLWYWSIAAFARGYWFVNSLLQARMIMTLACV